jgi:hypothetical protein
MLEARESSSSEGCDWSKIVGCNITAKRNILKDAFGSSAKMKIPKCTLDHYALIKSHSGIKNSESNPNRMKNQMVMT